MKTANLAIVFTDIKGFTERTSRQTLEQNQRLLAVHSELLTPIFQSFGGRVVKSIGDAFLVTFESPTQAVLAGVAIQDRLWFHNRTAPAELRLDVRIAINVGEVRVENRDVFGEPVNIAARVEGIAEAGEVYFTEAVYLSMNKAEVPSEEVGEFELKGIPGKVHVYRVPHGPYRVEAPPAASQTGGMPAVEIAPEGATAQSAALPPFGNLGLARMKDEGLLQRLSTAPELKAAGAQLQAAISTLADKTTRAVADVGRSQRPAWLTPRLLVPAGVVLVVVVALAAFIFGSNEVEAAIDEVREAKTDDARRAAVQKARAAIGKITDACDKLMYSGQLDEAEDDFRRATNQYVAAAKKECSGGESRILELLSHDSCSARSEAADAIAELRLTRAKSDLEDLAESGGPGDGSGGVLGLGACDSKQAARQALRRLE